MEGYVGGRVSLLDLAPSHKSFPRVAFYLARDIWHGI